MIQKFLQSKISGYLFIVAAIALTGALVGGYYFIRHQGYKACEQAAIVKQVDTMEKRNEIARNRPDDAATIDRMRNGTF